LEVFLGLHQSSAIKTAIDVAEIFFEVAMAHPVQQRVTLQKLLTSYFEAGLGGS
jgi:hypothetical protein